MLINLRSDVIQPFTKKIFSKANACQKEEQNTDRSLQRLETKAKRVVVSIPSTLRIQVRIIQATEFFGTVDTNKMQVYTKEARVGPF